MSSGCTCTEQPVPNVTRGPPNNTAAIAYWRGAAAHARAKGWLERAFDYTCDEPGADPRRYPVCKARADAVHAADPGLKVMITAEKPSADSVNISALIDIWSPILNFMDNNLTLCRYPSLPKKLQFTMSSRKQLLLYRS